MSKITVITSTLLLTFSMSAVAGGGNNWEKRAEKIQTVHVQHGSPTASEMNHTAVQHKRWLFDGANNSMLDADTGKPYPSHRHTDHMASDHKRMSVGSN